MPENVLDAGDTVINKCQHPGFHEAYILEIRQKIEEKTHHMLTASGTCDKGHQREAEGTWGRLI